MKIDPTTHSQTLYIPIASPPTPSPSPAPVVPPLPFPHSHAGLTQPAIDRRTFLTAVLRSCTPAELHFVAESLAPLLKRDFLSALPPELNLHILSFIDDPRTLVRTGAVSRAWRAVASAEIVWKRMCVEWGFGTGAAGKQGGVQTETGARANRGGRGGGGGGGEWAEEDEPLEEMEPYADLPMDAALEWLTARKRRARRTAPHDSGSSSSSSLSQQAFSYRMYFRECYIKVINWERGGHRLRAHYLPMLSSSQHQQPRLTPSPLYSTSTSTSTPALAYHNQQQNQQDSGVVTSLALDSDWVVVGLASSRIHVFSARTGVLARTLVGHDSGVWGLCLVSASRTGSGSGTGKGKGKGKARAREEDVLLDLGELSLDGGGAPKHRRTTSARTRGIGGEDATEDGRYQLLPPALRAAVGLPAHSDGGTTSDDDGDGDDEDGRAGVGGRGIVDEDKEESYSYRSRDAEHQARHRRYRDAPPDSDSGPEPTPAQYVPERQSDPCFASEGWGQPNALVISGGCDKVVRVWDVKSGHCIYTLPGHTSTIRCMRTVHGRPLAVTGSRDGTVRTWDIQRGRAMRVLAGHTNSVRCLDVNGSRAASGSYDTTCRIWDLDTGECLHVLRGHYHQVYTVAFDGVLVATGGLDTTVRLWNADTGLCVALLQGHTSLVSQLQISRRHQLLVTGGSDGRIITFSLAEEEDVPVPMPRSRVSAYDYEDAASHPRPTPRPRLRRLNPSSSSSTTTTTTTTTVFPPSQSAYPSSSSSAPFPPPPQPQPPRRARAAYQPLYGISAHESSVTSLQFDGRFLVTGSNDGRVRLFETMTGRHVRDMWEGGECVWKVGFTGGGGGGRGRGRGRECAWDWQEGEGEGEGEEGEGVGDVCVFVGRRGVKTVLEVWGFGER